MVQHDIFLRHHFDKMFLRFLIILKEWILRSLKHTRVFEHDGAAGVLEINKCFKDQLSTNTLRYFFIDKNRTWAYYILCRLGRIKQKLRGIVHQDRYIFFQDDRDWKVDRILKKKKKKEGMESPKSSTRSIVNSALSDLIPKKSKRQYEKCYSEFKDWCDKQNVKTMSENILLPYLMQQSKVVKSST
ncbi:hypothetical protein NQ317_005483 [Molorchus minor]|uniref:Uncharacterized protein n=1 Tax=Molorchus minor TaxID=1323400 RepID=A0ABQ9JTE1_9CUCU|nr:hypothetical protein NQ317_005483 [Molorchus minor]